MNGRDAPALIDLDETSAAPSPADAPPVAGAGEVPAGQAMASLAALAAARPSRLWAWFWRLLGGIVLFLASFVGWNFVAGLVARNPVLGWAAVTLFGLFGLVCLAILLREWAALARLRRVERLQQHAARAIAAGDADAARDLVRRLAAFYAGREDMRWGRERLAEAEADVVDADTLIGLAEDRLLVPLDARAAREVEAAARQVATVTALVPLAFADVLAALTANVRMIRRVAEIYGGRAGGLGAWRLTRAVMTHLVATGAVAVGDDLIGSVGGGHLLGRISRRFGEGLVNGALTARVGVAAIEVCRPLPFVKAERPRVSALVRRALAGLFGGGED